MKLLQKIAERYALADFLTACANPVQEVRQTGYKLLTKWLQVYGASDWLKLDPLEIERAASAITQVYWEVNDFRKDLFKEINFILKSEPRL